MRTDFKDNFFVQGRVSLCSDVTLLMHTVNTQNPDNQCVYMHSKIQNGIFFY